MEATQRQMNYQQERERRMKEQRKQRQEQVLADEMRECTFSPNLGGPQNSKQHKMSVKGPSRVNQMSNPNYESF